MSSSQTRRYDPAFHFKQDLQEQGCGCCCNAFCWANVWLFLWLCLNIVGILFYSLMVYALYSPFGTVEFQCDENDDGIYEECDVRKVLEDQGITREVAIATLVVQCVITICNIFGFIGLWNCIPWMILLTVIIGLIGTIWSLVYFILAKQYYYIIALIVPLLLICFFISIYNTARTHQKEAKSYQNVQHQEPV